MKDKISKEWKKIPKGPNPVTPMSDQDRISPCNINTISSIQVMRTKKKKPAKGLLVDPIPNSLNKHHKNCMADSKENY